MVTPTTPEALALFGEHVNDGADAWPARSIFAGLDMASRQDASVLTYRWPITLERGDRVTMSDTSNRVRHVVDIVLNTTSCTIATHIRPSRGYARHVRRTKARAGRK